MGVKQTCGGSGADLFNSISFNGEIPVNCFANLEVVLVPSAAKVNCGRIVALVRSEASETPSMF